MSSSTTPDDPPGPATFRVPSFDGTTIHYDAYDAPSGSAVLVVPGFWRDRRHVSMVSLARLVQRQGFRAFVVDVRGHGDSEGTYGFNLHEHHDVAAVGEDILRRFNSVSALTLIGFSYGGAISISTMARHDLPIVSALLISPVADFAMITPKLNPLRLHHHIALAQALRRPRFSWAMRKLQKIRALDDIGSVHVPLCFIHVKNDWLIGHTHSEALCQAANDPKELHILDIEGNFHADRIFKVAADSVEPIVKEFLDRYTPR